MELRFINEQSAWDGLCADVGEPQAFLQSFAWGEIAKREGKNVVRVAVFAHDGPVLAAQLFFVPAPFKLTYALCPGGPLFLNKKSSNRAEAFALVVEQVQKKQGIFLRCEPSEKLPPALGTSKKTVDVTPRATTLLDVTKSEEALLAAMHPKTRYNITLAQKKELRLAVGKDFKAFWDLLQRTGARDKFRLHSRAHYEEIFASESCRQLTLYTAADGQPAATGVFFSFGKTFTYLFGASSYELRASMAPYLIQWEAIKLGKALGFTQYDFFGISPASEEGGGKHQYAGVTRFKLGFGGERLERPGTYDLLISPGKYRIYQALRGLRRLI